MLKRPRPGQQGMQHQQSAIGMPPQCLPFNIHRYGVLHQRFDSLIQQIEKLIGAAAGQPGGRIGLRIAGHSRRVIEGSRRAIDTQWRGRADGHDQRCIGAFVQAP